MTTIEKAVSFIKAIAADDSHGYDQTHRQGPDYDCSSLVIGAWKNAGVPLGCTYTGNMYADMLKNGFSDVTAEVNLATGAGLQNGDVLLNHANHTGMWTSGGITQARSNEFGGITGGQSGDQTGREITTSPYYNYPWDAVLRYMRGTEAEKSAQTEADAIGGTYTVKSGDTLWGIAEKHLGSGLRYRELMTLNGLTAEVIFPGQTLRLSARAEEKVILTVSVKESTADALLRAAGERNRSIGEILDELF